jgi:hydrogenase maturation factor HypE
VTLLKTSTLPEAAIVESQSTSSSKEKILKMLTEIDEGNGVSIDDIIRLSKVDNAEEIITDMLLKGEIFEIKAGRIKIL